jgi:glutamine synthetase
MTQEARITAINDSVTRPARSVEWPKTGQRHSYPSEIFGQNVFTLKTLQQTLPKTVYARFIQQIKVSFIGFCSSIFTAIYKLFA